MRWKPHEVSQEGRAVLIGASGGFDFALGALAVNLSRFWPADFEELIVFSPSMSGSDWEIIEGLLPAKFVRFMPAVKPLALAASVNLRSFTKFSLGKLEALRLVDHYDSVTWLDFDVLVKKDLQFLTSVREPAIKILDGERPLAEEFLWPLPSHFMAERSFATGTFAVSRHLPQRAELLNRTVEIINKYAGRLLLPDQAAFSLALHEFGVLPQVLDSGLFAVPPDRASGDTAIIHAFGPRKFWLEETNSAWWKNYTRWLQLGGSSIPRPSPWQRSRGYALAAERRLVRAVAEGTRRRDTNKTSLWTRR